MTFDPHQDVDQIKDSVKTRRLKFMLDSTVTQLLISLQRIKYNITFEVLHAHSNLFSFQQIQEIQMDTDTNPDVKKWFAASAHDDH